MTVGLFYLTTCYTDVMSFTFARAGRSDEANSFTTPRTTMTSRALWAWATVTPADSQVTSGPVLRASLCASAESHRIQCSCCVVL